MALYRWKDRWASDRGWTPAGRDRELWGCIVTFRNQDGRTLSLHRTGRDALTQCCDDALSLDTSFQVQSISTPETIYTDLRGRLPHPTTEVIPLPEHARLGRLRRMHLLHPSIQPRSSEAVRHARRRGDMW